MIINVLVEQRVNKNDQLFSYLVPNSLIDKIEVGKRVLIPFNNQKIEGFIMDTLTNEKEFDYELKEIIDVIDENPVLNREMIELGQYMSNLYLAPLISCYQTMLPVALKAKNKTSINIKLETYIVLNQDENEIKKYLKYNKIKSQHTILSLLLKEKKCLKKEFKSASSLKTLISKGLIKETKKEVYRLDSDIDVYKKVKLTDEQVKVVKEIINSKEQKLLLHGVTGSGKTEVYMEVIEHVINNGQTAIVLVPEISLTTQLASRFKSRFQEKVAILHSRLSAGEKYDEWRKIERGEVSIVIGARSAVFAPLSNIGVIIIDEEHETTYKQENNPRYHTIDIAGWRINRHQAKLVLGGATPSLDRKS
ncbi:MAG: DEAD/DEAH box helicase family protein, partial [Bacilli bacterium]|nr:DEAD/DEAH box helicase family protein [Bacilli bacterium]